ncbi:MAG: hypothetical protein LLG05_10255 [Porphyromonadaceae bacterium]|nr:hypothetical protein [Porphyromonadaceae bacterium]
MSDLWTPTKRRFLKKSFRGRRIFIGSVLCVPVVILDYEITFSQKSEDKELLVLQLSVGESLRMLWTEAYKLINTIREAENKNRALPFYTKIVQSKGYYEFAKLTETERRTLTFK